MVACDRRPGDKNVVNGLYRYYWDTWGLTAHTAELGYGRFFGDAWLANTFVRYHTQQGAVLQRQRDRRHHVRDAQSPAVDVQRRGRWAR